MTELDVRLSVAARLRHVFAFAVLITPLVVGPFLDVTPQRATLFGVEGPQCPSRLVTEHGCPGCGLTRGTALLLQGRAQTAVSVQPAAFVLVVSCLLGAWVRGDILLRNRMTSMHVTLIRWGHRFFAVVVISVWLGRSLLDS